jgi:hypothetical protein
MPRKKKTHQTAPNGVRDFRHAKAPRKNNPPVGLALFYVTHMYEFARRVHEQRAQNVLFLRAERLADGTRTFKVKEGEPVGTSYGADLYERIFVAGETEREGASLSVAPDRA